MFVEILFDIIIVLIFYSIFIVLSIAFHELGHLVFGLITGYRFCSFRLFSFVWFKEDGKIKFQKTKFIFMGQCLMAPPFDESKFRFVWYNLGGGLFNIIALLIAILFAVVSSTFNGILTAVVAANAVFAVLSLVPMNSYVPNDAMNIKKALQSEAAKRGFYIMLFVNSETTSGKRFRDFDSELFQVKEPADFDNYFAAYTAICEAARLYDTGEYDKSFEQYNRLNIEKLQGYYKSSVNLDLLYFYIVHKPDFEKAKKLYADKEMQTLLHKLGTIIPSCKRVRAAYEYFVNDDKEKGRRLLEEAKNEIENYPNSGYRIMEKDYCLDLELLL
jgi:hypothetical protein